MDGFFYRLGRLAGPAVRKGKWFWRSLAGSEADAIRAENEVGRDLARVFHEAFPPDPDDAARSLVHEVGTALAARVRNKLRRFSFAVVAAETPNAFALPGGYIFLTRPLLDLVERDRDEVAFILGHEAAHVIRQDPFERTVTDTAVSAALRALPGGGTARTWLKSVGAKLLQSSYSRERELAADELGLRLARAAGFDPEAALRMLGRLRSRAAGKEESLLGPYFSTHPPFELRIRELKRVLAGR